MPLTPRNQTRQGFQSPDRAFQTYDLHRPGRIILVGHHLSARTHIRCIVTRVSLYGAVLDVSPHLDFPNNFFLEILGIRDEIGCTVISREEEVVTVGFNMLLAQDFLIHILRIGHETTH